MRDWGAWTDGCDVHPSVQEIEAAQKKKPKTVLDTIANDHQTADGHDENEDVSNEIER